MNYLFNVWQRPARNAEIRDLGVEIVMCAPSAEEAIRIGIVTGKFHPRRKVKAYDATDWWRQRCPDGQVDAVCRSRYTGEIIPDYQPNPEFERQVEVLARRYFSNEE